MIGWICFILLCFGTVYGVFNGTLPAVSQAILATPGDCVSLLLKIGGSICFFSGLMRVAEASGLVGRFSRLLSRPLRFLIPHVGRDAEAAASVSLNISSNVFGLGNAATPYGIRAASCLAAPEMSRSLATFLILNTCSVQLIPTTVLALRQANGSVNPTDILPSVWVIQVVTCVLGILLTRWLFREAK